MFIDDYIEKIALQEEVKNLKSMNETLASEKLELKDQNTVLKYSNSVLKKNAAECKLLLEEKQQEGDNLRNRIKDLETEIDQLKSNPSTVSDSELLAIHTADVETINKLNIRARDLNGTISTLLERVSTYDKENQELKKKVQRLQQEKDFLTKQVEHLQSCLDLEKDGE